MGTAAIRSLNINNVVKARLAKKETDSNIEKDHNQLDYLKFSTQEEYWQWVLELPPKEQQAHLDRDVIR